MISLVNFASHSPLLVALHPPQVKKDGLPQWPVPGKLHMSSNRAGGGVRMHVCVCVCESSRHWAKRAGCAKWHHNVPLYSGSVVGELLTSGCFLREAAKHRKSRFVCWMWECVWLHVCLMENWRALLLCFVLIDTHPRHQWQVGLSLSMDEQSVETESCTGCFQSKLRVKYKKVFPF